MARELRKAARDTGEDVAADRTERGSPRRRFAASLPGASSSRDPAYRKPGLARTA
jgi:hypothetical protein